MNTIAICGTGGSGREFLDLIERIGEWNNVVFCDKDEAITEDFFRGRKVLSFEAIKKTYTVEDIAFTISVGDVYLREKIYKQITEEGYKMATIVAPNVIVPQSVKMGRGVIIRDNCYISVDSVLGDNVMIQPNVVIGHDANIGMNSVVASHSVISGATVIGKDTYIAIGCMIKEMVEVGDDCIVSMGTVVNRSIPQGVIVRGNPMEIVSKNILGSAFVFNKRREN